MRPHLVGIVPAQHDRRGVVCTSGNVSGTGPSGVGPSTAADRAGTVRRSRSAPVEVEPLGLIEEHGGHDPPVPPVRGDELWSATEPWVNWISSAYGGTPTDLMLTPNWIDQNAGTEMWGHG